MKKLKGITLDPKSQCLVGKKGMVSLTILEYCICKELFDNVHQVVTSDELQQLFAKPSNDMLRHYIRTIRTKIAKLTHAKLIHTKSGVGYLLTDKLD